MTVNRIVEIAKVTVPRCIAGFHVQTDTEVTAKVMRAFRRDSDDSIAYELRTNLLSEKPVLLGAYLDKEWPHRPGRILVSPLSIRWMPSRTVIPLFDGNQHGYNAEYGFGRVHAASANLITEWVPPEGPRENLLFVACFSYNPADQDNMNTDELMRGHPQDFFEMFLLAAYSLEEDSVIFVTEFECA
jgi:hypothetical protein